MSERRASSPAGKGATKPSRSWASIGTSWIWSGSSSLHSSIFGEVKDMAQAVANVEGQQHPIRLYLVVWGWLFILSALSYSVDYFHLQGYLRWFLILLFMFLKAGLIVAVFMHLACAP